MLATARPSCYHPYCPNSYFDCVNKYVAKIRLAHISRKIAKIRFFTNYEGKETYFRNFT